MANTEKVNNFNNISLCDSNSSVFICMHHKQETTLQNLNNIQQKITGSIVVHSMQS
jgi:hypothetical protein